MGYSLQTLIETIDNGATVKFLFFWGHQKSKTGELTSSCFSQWWPSPFVVDGVTFSTAEHWMMAQKALLFDDRETYAKIIEAKTPAEAKKLGRQVQRFHEATWNERRMDIVVRGNLEKFQQDPELKNFLLNTNDRVLVEASPVDTIWGIGLTADSNKANNPSQWNGLNLLGFALMEVRDMLRK